MRTLSIGTRTLLLGMLACASLFIVVLPHIAHAQKLLDNLPPTVDQKVAAACKANPASCQSFDPKVNPVLAGYKIADISKNSDGSSKFTTDTNGQCLWYLDSANVLEKGCLNGGNFTVAGDLSSAAPGVGAGTSADATISKDQTGAQTVTRQGTGCRLDDPGSWFSECILNSLAFFILGFANFVLGIVGVLLNWVVVKTVFQFSQLIGNSAGLLAAWKILRDIGNLVLLFGFVLMGLGTILETSKLPDKKAIPTLIVFAILLNFSIFAAEAVIDTSNVLTSVLYTQSNTNPCATETCDINNGIAGHIMQSTGLSGIYALSGANKITTSGNKAIIIIGLTLFATIGTVVLLAAAIMLAWRAIVLTGLIIVSPIGFAGMALPGLKKQATQWWSMLIHQSFFAPILFLLIFIDLRVTEGFSAVTNNNGLASALSGPGTSNMGIIMVFLLITGGLVAALMAAKSFGAMGADFAIKTAGGVAFGSGAWVTRRTLGAGSAALSRSIRSSNLGSSRIGRGILAVTDKGASSSYDFRGNKFVGDATKKMKIDLGKPSKDASKGYIQSEKNAIEAKTKHAKSLTMSKDKEEKKKVLDEDLKRKQAEIKGAKNDPETKELRKKVAENKDNAKVEELTTQIAAEKLNSQRLASTGTIEEQAASARRIESLTKQRDEYVNATQALKEKEGALKNLEKEEGTIQAQIDALSPQMRYAKILQKEASVPILGSFANKDAAKKILKDAKKTKGQKATDDIIAAIKKGGEDAATGIEDKMQEVAEEAAEESAKKEGE